MKIIFCEKLPRATTELAYTNYNQEDLKIAGATYFSLKDLAKTYEEKFFHDIEIWHSQVCLEAAQKNRFWWMTQAARLMSWAPPIFTPLFFNYLIKILQPELLEKNVKEFYIINAPKEAIDLASDFFQQIEVQAQAQPLMTKPSFFNNQLKPYLAYIKNLIFGKLATKNLEPRPYVIHSTILSPKNILNKIDHYFGSEFFNIPLEERKKITWLFFYPQNDRKVKKQVIRFFEDQGFQIAFTYDYVGFIDLIKIFLISIKLKIDLKKLGKTIPNPITKGIIAKKFKPMYAHHILQGKLDSLSDLELYFTAKKLFKTLKPKRFIYAFEERSIERALLMANSENQTPAESFGFIHSVMHQGHLCFDPKSNQRANPPRPNYFLVTGMAAYDWFISKGYNEKRIKVIGSPRCVLKYTPKTKPPSPLKILFLVGQAHELIEFASLITNESQMFNNIQLTIRRYPYGWFDDQQRGVDLIKKIIPQVIEENATLHEQLEKNDMAFFSTSSSGIEAVMNGKIAFYIKLDQFHNLNPLEYAKKAKSLIQCLNRDDLKNNLSMVKNLSTEQWNDLTQKQMQDAQLIYQKFNAKVFMN